MSYVKLVNGSTYDIIPMEFRVSKSVGGNDMLRLILVGNDDITFDGIDGEFSIGENISRILLVNDGGVTEDVASGYTILRSIEKCNDYLIENRAELLDDGTYRLKEIRGTVYVLILEKPDVWTQFEQLRETVDMMVLSGLEEV